MQEPAQTGGEQPAGGECGQAAFCVDVVGELREMEFPDVCVHCGRRAHNSINIHKLFRRVDTDSFVHGMVAVPCCDTCTHTHEAEIHPIPRAVKSKLLRSWFYSVLPDLLPLIFLCFSLGIGLVDFLVWGKGRDEVGYWVLFMAALAAIAWALYSRIREQGALLVLKPADTGETCYVNVDYGWSGTGIRFVVPTEPTSVARAIDFTDDTGTVLEPEQHRFTFLNSEVGRLFAVHNARRKPKSVAARPRMPAQLQWVLITGVVIAGLFILIGNLLP